jgi:hypothetical protein
VLAKKPLLVDVGRLTDHVDLMHDGLPSA